jgi:hypothetical protein
MAQEKHKGSSVPETKGETSPPGADLSRMVQSVSPFPPMANGNPSIDAVLLTFYPTGAPSKGASRLSRRFKPTPKGLTALVEIKALKNLKTRGPAVIREDGKALRLDLGGHQGGDARSCRGSVRVNVLRSVRQRLLGVGSRAFEGGAREVPNFINPEDVPPGVDLSRECQKELLLIVSEERDRWARWVERVFGFRFLSAQVGASISQIELCLDAPCAVARHVPTAWEKVWRDTFVGSSVVASFTSEDGDQLPGVAKREATLRKDPDALPGSLVLAMSYPGPQRFDFPPVLRRDQIRGEEAKLYVKHSHLVRAEVRYSGGRIRTLLKRSLRLDSTEVLAKDLNILWRRFYGPLLEAQSALTVDVAFSLTNFFKLFFPGKRFAKRLQILEAFEAGGKFKNTAQEYQRELTDLRRVGVAEYRASGRVWAPTASFMPALHFLQRRGRAIADAVVERRGPHPSVKVSSPSPGAPEA